MPEHEEMVAEVAATVQELNGEVRAALLGHNPDAAATWADALASASAAYASLREVE